VSKDNHGFTKVNTIQVGVQMDRVGIVANLHQDDQISVERVLVLVEPGLGRVGDRASEV